MDSKFFVEIGSCDFDTCLPLAANGWRGIVVEPHSEIFPKVQEMFAPYDVVCAQCVVTEENALVPFREASGRGWQRGISHVDNDTHYGAKLSENPANKRLFGEAMFVEGVTLDKLLNDNEVEKIDFLKIDTEGHEVNILREYSWRVKPKFIKVEHKHTDDLLICEILNFAGYMTWTERHDIYAVG